MKQKNREQWKKKSQRKEKRKSPLGETIKDNEVTGNERVEKKSSESEEKAWKVEPRRAFQGRLSEYRKQEFWERREERGIVGTMRGGGNDLVRAGECFTAKEKLKGGCGVQRETLCCVGYFCLKSDVNWEMVEEVRWGYKRRLWG